MGDGGMVVTSDEKLAAKIEILRNHGAEPKYFHDVIGGNFRLDALQAAILRVKLSHLASWHQGRRHNANRYNEMFKQSGLTAKGLVQPPIAAYQSGDGAEKQDYHIYNQYVIRVQQRDSLRDFLLKNSIGVEIYYPLALHQQKCVKGLGCIEQTFPQAEKAAKETLALPVYPELTAEMQQYVVDTIAEFYSQP
jgi:dTDP-4-amino-4,6-dideoxygalactose transaminase